jgi:hypothetical protein
VRDKKYSAEKLLQFAELSLPSVTLDKTFAKCFPGFAECFRHSVKRLFPVVKRGGLDASLRPTLPALIDQGGGDYRWFLLEGSIMSW